MQICHLLCSLPCQQLTRGSCWVRETWGCAELLAPPLEFRASAQLNQSHTSRLLLETPAFIMDCLPFTGRFSLEHGNCFENVNSSCISSVVCSSYLSVTVITINTRRHVLGELRSVHELSTATGANPGKAVQNMDYSLINCKR